MNKDKIIFTDIDGVVLNWSSNLPYFLANMNMDTTHIVDLLANGNSGEAHWSPETLFPEAKSKESAKDLLISYCNSDYMASLSSWMDSLQIVNKLIKEGYKFVGVTALVKADLTVARRIKNIEALFPNGFLEIVHVGIGNSKHDAFIDLFEKYGIPLCYIDDRYVHLDEYKDALEKVKNHNGSWEFNLIEHSITDKQESTHKNRFVVNSWFDIYNKIKAIEHLTKV